MAQDPIFPPLQPSDQGGLALGEGWVHWKTGGRKGRPHGVHKQGGVLSPLPPFRFFIN